VPGVVPVGQGVERAGVEKKRHQRFAGLRTGAGRRRP
jgi:hypothetical protein